MLLTHFASGASVFLGATVPVTVTFVVFKIARSVIAKSLKRHGRCVNQRDNKGGGERFYHDFLSVLSLYHFIGFCVFLQHKNLLGFYTDWGSKDSLGVFTPAGQSLALKLRRGLVFVYSLSNPLVGFKILGCAAQIKTPPNGGV